MKVPKKIAELLTEYYETFKHWGMRDRPRTERRSLMKILEDAEVLEARRYTTFRF